MDTASTIFLGGTGFIALLGIVIQVMRLLSTNAKGENLDKRVNNFTSGLLRRVNILEKENAKLNDDLRASLESVGVLQGKIFLMSAQMDDLQEERKTMKELLGKVKTEYDKIKLENFKLQETIKAHKLPPVQRDSST